MARPFHTLCCLLLLAGQASPAPPVNALAYGSAGAGKPSLAAGVGRSVMLIDPATGEVVRKIADLPGPVTALAWHGNLLAVAAGLPGKPGIVRIVAVTTGEPHEFAAHADAVYGMAFSDDGKSLATAGYDNLVKLWDTAAGREIQTLKDHSDAVFGLVWHGNLIATCAADRTVKMWNATTGKRLYSLTDSTDWLYAVAFSPDGQFVAAGGVDKSIRVWRVDENEGKLATSFFAHDGPILRLCFAPDGQSLYSLAEDRRVKVWDWRKGTEVRPIPKLGDDAITIAISPDGKQFAVGGHNGTLSFYNAASGVLTTAIVPKQPPPKIASVSPNHVPRGQLSILRVAGSGLEDAKEIASSTPGVSARFGESPVDAAQRTVAISVAADVPPGTVTMTFKSPHGDATVELAVDCFAEAQNDEGGLCPLNATLAGMLTRSGEVDSYQFDMTAKQEVGAAVTHSPKGKLNPVLELTAADGRIVAEGGATLGFVATVSGRYRLSVRDRDYRGGAPFSYRLHVGAIPVVTGVFPLGICRGAEADITLHGVHIASPSIHFAARADAAVGDKLNIPVAGALGKPALTVGEFPESSDCSRPLSVPGTGNGVIAKANGSDVWTFSATAGQRLVIEALARRYGSPLDPMIEILDKNGRAIEQARLQCVAKTVTVLRDVPAKDPNIRLESWNEYAADDFVLMGQELIKIEELPGHPDADCAFYSVGGSRQTFLGTTAGLHPLGVAMYRVKVHPPGTAIAANGYPIVPIYYRNDDGGPGYGKDARLMFIVPADGEYKVRVTDARGDGGDLFAYRLTVRPPKPDFSLKLSNADPVVARGQAVALGVTADRRDGFDGPIRVHLDGLPAGFSSVPMVIQAGLTRASIILAAANDAHDSPADAKFTLIGEAPDHSLRREVKLGRPKLGDAGDIVTHIEQADVHVQAGHETTMRVRIERKNGFAGRVPLEMRGLPHGVRALHIGLNGILINEKESTRTIALFAEPWVAPGDYPITVMARREGKNTEHAATPVLLRVEK